MRLAIIGTIFVACLGLTACGSPGNNQYGSMAPPPSNVYNGGHDYSRDQSQPVQQASFTTFPSSKRAATGTPWKDMHEHGNKESFATNCRELDLNAAECGQYQQMVDGNACAKMSVQNGVVLDYLTFTDSKTGKAAVQRRVKVALVNPISRDAIVCDLGNGKIVGRFFGCDNHFRVDGSAPPVRKAENGCQMGEATFWVVIRDYDKLPAEIRAEVDQKVREASRGGLSASSFQDQGRLSRSMGDELRPYQRAPLDIKIPLVFFHEEDGKIVDDGPAGIVELHDGIGYISAENLMGKNVAVAFPFSGKSPVAGVIRNFDYEWTRCDIFDTAVYREELTS